MDIQKFFIEFEDFMAPQMDTYEQSIYLYIFRHSRLIDQEEVVIGFKSVRKRMACGVGEHGKPMAENTAYKKLQSLEIKGFVKILGSERSGQRIKLFLPHEIKGIIPEIIEDKKLDLEEMDFFEFDENRKIILEREGWRCFYCMCKLNNNNFVMEHVVSRPNGNNSYRNIVAACRSCNNKKDNVLAEDFLRTLYRDSLISENEFKDRLNYLIRLKNGELKPDILG
jgi:hypothetical protein